jgi:hypothetical protein
MLRHTRPVAVLIALAAVVALVPSASAGPTAVAAKSCSVGDSRSYNTTYVLGIRAYGTSCRSARRLIRAFHACRPGKRGHCGHVKGYRCRESRFNKSRQSYDSRVKCRRGGKVVKHTYTQFL